MPMKKPTGASRWVDPDEAPPLDREWFERAEIREGEQRIRTARTVGRPKKAHPSRPSTYGWTQTSWHIFRATGPGWQSRINQALRKAAGL
ncbi:MAG: hypothetical protein K0R41_2663 [Geminicoccaceae bacterium]|nr:hypothetical protein [Geminicoccaceae bacterium]MCE3248838.1 hypothetical protein [Geminicoccaceae bacterium]